MSNCFINFPIDFFPAGSKSSRASEASQSSHLSAAKFFDGEIGPNIQQAEFWFPLVDAPAPFRDRFLAANEAVGPTDDENTVYHPNFQGAWEASFPPCAAHQTTRRAEDCPTCSAPRLKYSARNPPSAFELDAPDFIFSARDSGKSRWAGVVEIKRKDGHIAAFKKEDIAQVVKYGNRLLSTQPLRDHATVCLFTLHLVQFFQVFRGSRVIRATDAQSLGEDALDQLYSYLTAPAAVHGIRDIPLKLMIIPQPIERLGSGSFATVLKVRSSDNDDAALKLYQRYEMSAQNPTEYDTTLFDREVKLLKAIARSEVARPYAPTIVGSDRDLQYILLTPVGRRLSCEMLDVEVVGRLVDAVRALHTVCIHRDLRAANIICVGSRPMIIDWNLGLELDKIVAPQRPAGAVFVQGFKVLKAMSTLGKHMYTHSDDLQSLVRALYLLVHNTTISPDMTAKDWAQFWEPRLQGPVPPQYVHSHWVAAEALAVQGDYEVLKAHLQAMLTRAVA